MATTGQPCASEQHEMQRVLLDHLIRNRQKMLQEAVRIVRDPCLAEDIVQEAAIRCLKSGAVNEGIGNPLGVLRCMVRNLSLDQLRSESRRKQIADGQVYDQPCWRPGPESRLINQQSISLVLAEIGKLPERDRNIFLCYRIENKRQKEIAFDRGLSTARVNSIIHHVTGRLRETIHV